VRGEMRGIGSDAKLAAANVAKNLAKIGVAAAGLAVAGFGMAVKQAGDFQQQMELLHTQAGVAQKDIAGMSTAVLDMSSQVGTSAQDLSMGLFHVTSTGLRGQQALDALKVAAEGAKVGLADLEDTTTVLAGAVMTGIKGTENMGAAMGALNAIVGAGNMRMADLIGAFKTGILPSAKAAGLTLTDVGAALAQMADQTIPPEEGATRLRMTISLLAAQTPKATKALKSIGINQYQLGNDMRKPNGLLVALQDLRSHLDKSGLSLTEQNALLVRAFGGGKTSSGILTLIGNIGLLKSKYDLINEGASKFNDAWAATQATAAFQFAQLKTNIQTVAIKIGAVLLPKVNDVVKKLNDWIGTHGGLVDKIASAGVEYFDKLGKFLTGLPWGAIASAFKLMGAGAKAALDLFLSAPPWLQTAVLTGWGLNKLTGGVLGKIVGSLASGLIKGILGINAGVVNVKGAVVNTVGGGPGGGLPTGGPGGPPNAAPTLNWAERLLSWLPGLALAGGQFAEAASHDALQKKVQEGYVNSIVKKASQQGSAQAAIAYLKDQETRNAALGPAIKAGLEDAIKVLQSTLPGALANALNPANPAHTADYASRHPESQKPAPKLTAAAFLADISKSMFMGPKGYQSLWEKVGGSHGQDPFGQMFLSLLSNVKPRDLKTAGVQTEIKGHLKELVNLEKYYIQHGDTKAAAEVQKTVDAIDALTGIITANTPVQQRQLAEARSYDAAMLAATRKKVTVNVHATIPISTVVNFSINDWQRKVISSIRASAGSGGFI
jgi:TP901 family phage tail tape measure protein